MGTSYGASQFAGLLNGLVLHAPLASSAVTTTAKTITANGGVTQSTAVLDPWGLARPVGYFDGNDDHLSFPYTDFNFGTGNFTIECRFRLNAIGTDQAFYSHSDYDQSPNSGHLLRYRSDNVLQYEFFLASVDQINLRYTITLTINTWYHIAVVRNGTSFKMYLNGNEVASGTSASSLYTCTDDVHIGIMHTLNYGYTNDLNGYLSEFHISNVARYTANFTPSITRFKPDSYTKLLLHMYGSGATFVDDPFIDYDEYPVIPSGVTATNSGTFTKTNLGNNRSVLNFDGSTNYISLTDSTSWNIFEGDFTIAGWVNMASVATTKRFVGQDVDINNRWTLYWSPSSSKIVLYGISSSSATFQYGFTVSPSINTWYYITVVKSGLTCLMFLDGLQQIVIKTVAFTGTTNIASVLRIGLSNQDTTYMYGNLKDLMIWKSRALSQAEIKLLMNRTHPLTGAGLMPANGKYWRLS